MENKKKNRYRDAKKTNFKFWRGLKKEKLEKVILPKDTIKGIYSQMQGKDFGFVDVEWEEKWYFVIDRNRNWAFDWDEVVAELKTYNWKPEAVILDVTKRSIRTVVWEFQYSKKKWADWSEFWFVVPNSSGFKSDIFISWDNFNWAKNKDIVWVEITSYLWRNPSGIVKEVLWKKWDKNIDVESFILEAGFSTEFNEKLTESKKKSDKIEPKEISRRKDFRKLFTFTIDWEDAKDLDDAISIKKKENWTYKLYIHIADVAHYVEENSSLDKEARKRATSVYLADRVIPMLPEFLSNDLCSLNTWSDKLSLTCEVLISKEWKFVKSTVYESIIRSNYRMTYKEVDEVISGKIVEWVKLFCDKDASENLIETLKLAEELRLKINGAKNEQWVLNFDFPETKLVLDENKELVEIKEYPKYESNNMIEEFMVMANEAVSRKFDTFPFLYRIHENPSEESVEKLKKLLNLFSIDFKFNTFNTKELWQLLTLINNNWDNFRKAKLTNWQIKFLEKSILRTLSKAIYSEENKWHFGLGLNFYSHFTSPIRRYPDLQIHRIIKEKLQDKLNQTRIIHYKNLLPKVANVSSDQERKAEKLEYKVRDYYICNYYKDKIWSEFSWIITTVLPYGVFVQLEDTSEWFIEFIPKIGAGKWFFYNEEFMRFDNPGMWKQFNLWDEVSVILDEVDTELLRINFKLK